MLSSELIPYVLDIRDADDRKNTGQIAGSNCICLDDLSIRLKEIPRDRQVVIVDLHGKQSKIAARYLASKGVSNLYILKDGFVKDWVRHGYPVQK